MNESLIHGLAVLLQLLAIVLAIVAIRVSGKSLAWLLLSAAFLLQGVRRGFEFLIARGYLDAAAVHGINNWLALTISVLMVFGVYRIKEIFVARREAEQALEKSEYLFRLISESATDCIFWIDSDNCFRYVSPACKGLFDHTPEEFYAIPGLMLDCIHPEDRAAYVGHLEQDAANDAEEMEFRVVSHDGSERWIAHRCSRIYDADGNYLGRRGSNRDITARKLAQRQTQAYLDELARSNVELQSLNDELVNAQNNLLHSEKMASIGLLAAGVAHEINNPVGYISSNLATLSKYVDDFLRLINAYEQSGMALLPGKEAVSTKEVEHLRQSMDLAFEQEDVKTLISESRLGVERVKRIVQDLKDFSRVDTDEDWNDEDIHTALERTLSVVWNELKYSCELRKEYGNLPPVQCLIFQLSQVFMNLLINAAQAIDTKGTIVIRTGTKDELVWIEIADTGKGISPQNLHRIFDPFFTTKPPGKGTGLGLSVSYSIVQKHHGRIEVESAVGKGTTFRIWLPLRQPPTAETAAVACAQ